MITYFTLLFYVAKKNDGKKENPDKLLHFYLCQNLVLIKKITEYGTTYFTYGTMVNVNSDVDRGHILSLIHMRVGGDMLHIDVSEHCDESSWLAENQDEHQAI